MIRALSIAVAALAFAGTANATTNLVTNGGFEAVAPGSPASFEIGPHWNYNGALTGWTSSAGSPTNSNGAFNVLFDSATATTVNADTRDSAGEAQKIASEN